VARWRNRAVARSDAIIMVSGREELRRRATGVGIGFYYVCVWQKWGQPGGVLSNSYLIVSPKETPEDRERRIESVPSNSLEALNRRQNEEWM